jgi:hypothetical protein
VAAGQANGKQPGARIGGELDQVRPGGDFALGEGGLGFGVEAEHGLGQQVPAGLGRRGRVSTRTTSARAMPG